MCRRLHSRSSNASPAKWGSRMWLAVPWFVPVITPTTRRWQPASCDKVKQRKFETLTQYRVRRMHMGSAGKPLYKSLYFQVIVAIVIGVLIGHFYPETGTAMKPLGDGFIKLIKMIPNTVVDAFAKGEILQVLLYAVLFGFCLHKFGGRGTLVFDFVEKISHVFFAIVGVIMKVAPIGAFGAMAFTIGKYGVGS